MPAGLQRELEQAWSDSVFDRFLVDEVQRRVSLDLVRRNRIGAVVEATVSEPTPERKVLRIEVRGGTQVARKQVRYQGTAAVDPGALAAVTTAYALDDWIWIEPTVVVDPIIEHYAMTGYRAVQVSPEAPRFDGDTAVITVGIVEGPVTRLADVRFEGVDPALQTEVEQAAHLPPNGPYVYADVDTARRQIEAVYRKRGYNDAVVTPKVVIDDPASAASVVFAVVPGREQRLAEVVVAGHRPQPPRGRRARARTQARHPGGLRAVGTGAQAHLRHQRLPAGGGHAGGGAG